MDNFNFKCDNCGHCDPAVTLDNFYEYMNKCEYCGYKFCNDCDFLDAKNNKEHYRLSHCDQYGTADKPCPNACDDCFNKLNLCISCIRPHDEMFECRECKNNVCKDCTSIVSNLHRTASFDLCYTCKDDFISTWDRRNYDWFHDGCKQSGMCDGCGYEVCDKHDSDGAVYCMNPQCDENLYICCKYCEDSNTKLLCCVCDYNINHNNKTLKLACDTKQFPFNLLTVANSNLNNYIVNNKISNVQIRNYDTTKSPIILVEVGNSNLNNYVINNMTYKKYICRYKLSSFHWEIKFLMSRMNNINNIIVAYGSFEPEFVFDYNKHKNIPDFYGEEYTIGSSINKDRLTKLNKYRIVDMIINFAKRLGTHINNLKEAKYILFHYLKHNFPIFPKDMKIYLSNVINQKCVLFS